MEEKLLVSFEVSGERVQEQLGSKDTFSDAIQTESGCHFSFSVTLKGDEYSKLKALKQKILKKAKILKQLKQSFQVAKECFDRLADAKGATLVKEWGIF